jgi:GNAT superfamily N-acetyltransferase
MTLRITAMDEAEIASRLGDLAALRTAVFAEYPYLYDGDLDYERRYLATYRDAPGAIVVGAWNGADLVGASTGTPLEGHDAAFAAPVTAAGIAPGQTFYCAESVLLPAWRGQGAGSAFFDLREAHARRLGLRYSAFCAVIRPPDHPARPQGYRPLDAFWRRRGYAELSGAIARFRWKDHGEPGETEKALQFWIRDLEEDGK